MTSVIYTTNNISFSLNFLIVNNDKQKKTNNEIKQKSWRQRHEKLSEYDNIRKNTSWT